MSFDDFKSNEGGEPPDGVHTASLADIAILETRNGQRIKLTWQTADHAYEWESWHGVEGRAKVFTKLLLRGLGVELTALGSWEELESELQACYGTVYEVAVERNGDWLNTSVEGKAADLQLDLPVDTNGLPPGDPLDAALAAAADDDIPF